MRPASAQTRRSGSGCCAWGINVSVINTAMHALSDYCTVTLQWKTITWKDLVVARATCTRYTHTSAQTSYMHSHSHKHTHIPIYTVHNQARRHTHMNTKMIRSWTCQHPPPTTSSVTLYTATCSLVIDSSSSTKSYVLKLLKFYIRMDP